MTRSQVSIRRPILTWMMTLALIVFGVLGFLRLGVDQFPNLEFPVLTVQAVLQGATPEGMEEDVTDVLEERLNTISGVRSIRSTSFQGVAILIVEFELGTNLDIAAQDVRDKVALARVELPVELEPPVVGISVVWILSLSATGMPCSGPRSLPWARSRSSASASRSACELMASAAFSRSSYRPILIRYCSTSWREVSCPFAIAACICGIVASTTLNRAGACAPRHNL